MTIETPATKILFLDIDGVLNSRRTCVAFDGYPHCYDQKNMARFDMVAIALVRLLCEETGASIVLSSSWRIDQCENTKKVAHYHANALDLPIIDCTPVLLGSRGFEINAWLSDHPEVKTYAIVDDHCDMLDSQKMFFVRTDEEYGLSLRNYLDLKLILRDSGQCVRAEP